MTSSDSVDAKDVKGQASGRPFDPVIEELEQVRREAGRLEALLEEELLRDAVMSARVALEELRKDSHGPPHERRRGIRLREKALKVERAFNRLRALRRGEMLPPRHPDDY